MHIGGIGSREMDVEVEVVIARDVSSPMTAAIFKCNRKRMLSVSVSRI